MLETVGCILVLALLVASFVLGWFLFFGWLDDLALRRARREFEKAYPDVMAKRRALGYRT
jgi:hypothetical protein